MEAIARRFEISLRQAEKYALVWRLFFASDDAGEGEGRTRKVVNGDVFSLDEPSWYVVAASESAEPKRWLAYAQDKKAEDPRYSIREFRSDIQEAIGTASVEIEDNPILVAASSTRVFWECPWVKPTAPVLGGQCLPASVLAATRARVDAKGTMISGWGQVDSRYEERLSAFVEGKRLARLTRVVRDRPGAFCDACGSTLPRTLFGLKDVSTGRYFFVGQNCLSWLMGRGSVARARYRQSAITAYELEMKTRLNGSNVDVSASPLASWNSGGVID